MAISTTHKFNGGVLSYTLRNILGSFIILFTFGIGLPWAVILIQTWKVENTYIEGRKLKFTGTGMGLFIKWIQWWILIIITFGIYGFWVGPRLQKWIVEHTEFDNN